MASALRFALLALALLAPLVFADIGPGPPAPTVTVYLVKDGQPETSITNITYNCLNVEEYREGAVEPRPAILGCSGGTCTNDAGWYYKFNPCFSFPGGHFTYELGGKTVKTGNFSFDKSYLFYAMTIDATSGEIRSKAGSDTPIPSSCLPGIALPAVLLAALSCRR